MPEATCHSYETVCISPYELGVYSLTNTSPHSCLAIMTVWPLIAGPCSFSDHRCTHTMTIPGFEHMAAKTAAPPIFQHLHSQVDLTLHLRIRVHRAQVNPAVNSWRAQALACVKRLPSTRSCVCETISVNSRLFGLLLWEMEHEDAQPWTGEVAHPGPLLGLGLTGSLRVSTTCLHPSSGFSLWTAD